MPDKYPPGNSRKELQAARAEALQRELADAGLNLFADLPFSSMALMSDARRSESTLMPALEPGHERRLLLLGNYGQDLWNNMNSTVEWRQNASLQHPLDCWVLQRVVRAMQRHLADLKYGFLYPEQPSEVAIKLALPDADPPALLFSGSEFASLGIYPPLQLLGERAGWHEASPLGIGVHKEWGLWFAYRALLVVDFPPNDTDCERSGQETDKPDANQDANRAGVSTGVCESCISLACIAQCPAQALQAGQAPNMQKCVKYRLSAESRCRYRCIAREACPIGPEHRYSTDQIDYHYRLSYRNLASVKPSGTR